MYRILLGCFGLVYLTAPAWAAVTPLQYTQSTLEQARAIVDSDQTHNEQLAALSALMKNFLDTDAIGRAALGPNWAKLTPAQQKEFLTLFHELFQRTYVEKLLLFDKPTFGYVGEKRVGDTARVDTKIITPRDEFTVTYQLRAQGDHWLATDIQIEDLSLTANFRTQLARLLSKTSVEGVLGRMRKKYGPGGAGGEGAL
ncbi:MAG TPA: ABC transporter substrate-binding protein [Candidatus Binatia bacterium]|nr:ABC transporter substrate-binding protein [Candidatus Binatia bacterium]